MHREFGLIGILWAAWLYLPRIPLHKSKTLVPPAPLKQSFWSVSEKGRGKIREPEKRCRFSGFGTESACRIPEPMTIYRRRQHPLRVEFGSMTVGMSLAVSLV